jgi:YVTN family beta-propeller protein
LFIIEIGCGDQYRPVANPIIGQGGQPQATHYAFLVNSNPTAASTTMRIDVSGDSNLETQLVGSGAVAEGFLAGSTGEIFTANSLSDSVSAFTTISTNAAVTTINVPLGSKPIAVTTQRSGSIYSLNSSPNANCLKTGSISVIDTNALAVTGTTCVGLNPVSFAQLPSGTKLYIANQADNTVSVYDPDAHAITTTITQAMGLGTSPTFVLASTDSSYVFVVNKGDGVNPGTLSIITTSNDQGAATVPLGIGPTFAYIDTFLNRLYVVNTGGNSITAFDLASLNLSNNPVLPTLATVRVGSGPVGVTALPNGTKVYVANALSNNITVISASSFGVLKTVPVGGDPVWIASEPTATKIYTANKGSGNVSIIATSNDTLVTNMSAPPLDPNCSSSCALQQPMMILTF